MDEGPKKVEGWSARRDPWRQLEQHVQRRALELEREQRAVEHEYEHRRPVCAVRHGYFLDLADFRIESQ